MFIKNGTGLSRELKSPHIIRGVSGLLVTISFIQSSNLLDNFLKLLVLVYTLTNKISNS